MFYLKSTFCFFSGLATLLILSILLHTEALGSNASSSALMNTTDFAGGDGLSPATAYQISNWHHLNNMRSYMTSHFVLLNDLNSSTDGYSTIASTAANGGQGWIPLGFLTYDFTGTPILEEFSGYLDGAGFAIRDLHIINPTDIDYAGFIQYGRNASIKDVHFQNINITHTTRAAGVAGLVFNTTIERVSVSGNISVPTDTDCESTISGVASGIVYAAFNSTNVSEVLTNVNIMGTCYLSAVVGVLDQNSSVDQVIARGTLNGSNFLGGIVADNTGTISNSYSTVTLQGGTSSGGLVATDTGSISNSWVSAGSPDGQVRPVTGACNSCTRSSVFYNTDAPPTLSEPSSANPLSNSTMIEQDFFAGFDFAPSTGIWQIGTEYAPSFPYLQAFTYDDPLTTNGPNPIPGLQRFGNGTGTGSDPYLISNWYHLNNVRHTPGSHHKLMNNLDSNSLAYEELASPQADGGQGWVPLGTYGGNFNGNGFAIHDLFINRPPWEEVGLFSILHGVVRNLMLIDVNITGQRNVGPIAGIGRNQFTVSNVYTSGFVGSAGYNSFGGIRGNSGGLIGQFDFTGNVYNVHTAVTLRGSNGGGLFGFAAYQGGTMNIYNVHVSGNFDQIFRRDWVGALIGQFNNTVVPQNIGGVFWDESVTGGLPIVKASNTLPLPGGGQALNGAQMRTKSVFENAGYDFDSIWKIEESDFESYPYLRVHSYEAPEQINPTIPIPGLRLKLDELTEEPLGPGTAMAFNGTSDYINTRMSDTMLGITESSFTVEAWIRVNNTSGDKPIIGHATGDQENKSLHLIVRNNRLNLGFFGNDLTGSPIIQADRWHHVAFVYDNDAGEQRLFVDGAADGVRQATAFEGHPDSLNAPIKIGRWLSTYFNGSMNDLRIWQGARSQAEIQANMNSSIPRNTSGLLANYTFNEAQKNGYFDANFTGNRIYEVTQNAPASVAFLVNNPSWFAPVMPLGQHSVFVAENQTQTLSDTGLSLEATPDNGSVSLYRYGSNDQGFITLSGSDPVAAEFGAGTVFLNRSNAVFGVFPSGNSVSGTLTLDYSFYEDGALQLLQRNSSGGNWERASGWVHDPINKTYTITGQIHEQQLALTRPVTQLQSRVYFAGDDASGNAQIALELTNNGLSDLAAVQVQITGNGIDNFSSESPEFSGTLWTVPQIRAGEQASLTLSGELSGYTGTITLTVSAGNFEPEPGSILTTQALAFPEAYGAEGALALVGGGSLSSGKTASELGLTNSSFTIETWVKFGNLIGDKPIIGADQNGNFSDHLHLLARNQRLHMGFWSNDTNGNTVLQTDKWYHAAFVYDVDTEEQRIYLNGQHEATGTERPPLTGNRELLIGKFVGNIAFDSVLDEFRIWNRALPEAEIRQHMNRVVQPADARFQDLIMYLRFDQRSGTTAVDFTGNTVNSFVGNPQWITASDAPIGQFGGSVQPGQPITSGPADAQASVAGLSGGGLSLVVSATNNMNDRINNDSGENFPGTIDARRRGVSWGFIPENGNTTGTITLNYGFTNQQTGLAEAHVYTQGLVERVLYREAAGQPWQIQTDWIQDDAAKTFTRNGPVIAGEYSTALVVDTIVPVTPNRSGWRMIGAPGPLATYTEVFADIWTQGYPGAGNSEDGVSNVYLYNETTRSWEIPQHSNHLFGTKGNEPVSSGRAAMIYMYEDDNELQIRHTGFPLITEAEISLTNTNLDGASAAAGWHLVSNPYNFPINWEAVAANGLTGVSSSIFIFDNTLFGNEGGYRLFHPETGDILEETGHSGIIPPFQGFWVKANASHGQTSTITIRAEHAASGGNLYQINQPDKKVSSDSVSAPLSTSASLLMAIHAEHPDSGREDVAIISLFDEDAQMFTPVYRPVSLTEHHMFVDLLDNEGYPTVLQFHTPEYGNVVHIPFNIRTTRSGMHRLRLSDEWLSHEAASDISIYVINEQTGERISWDAGSTIDLHIQASLKNSNQKTSELTDLQGSKNQNAVLEKKSHDQLPTKSVLGNLYHSYALGNAPRDLPNSLISEQVSNKEMLDQPEARFVLEIHYGTSTDTEDDSAFDLPLTFELNQNYPNPFNPTTTIQYGLPESATIRLDVFNMLGQRVATLVNGEQTAGYHSVQFDGRRLASGVYIYRLQTGKHVFTQKMVLVK